MNRLSLIVLIAFTAGLVLTAPLAAQEQSNPEIVATIGDKATITKTEFERALAGALQARMAQARRMGVKDPQKLAQTPVSHEEKLKLIDMMVNSKILYLLAQQAGVKVTDEQVDAEIDKHRAALPPNTTLEQFMEKQGTSLQEIKDLTRMRLASQEYSREQVKDISITDEQVQSEYENLKAKNLFDTADIAHILVRVTSDDPGAWEEAKKKIDAAYKRIKDGEDFAVVCKDVSDDDKTKDDGGVIKGAMRGILGPEFDQRMFTLPLNEVSEPFKSRLGWHILKVTDRGVAPLEGVLKERLTAGLLQQKKAQAIEKLISDARSTMKIQISLPPEAPAAEGTEAAPAPSLLEGAT